MITNPFGELVSITCPSCRRTHHAHRLLFAAYAVRGLKCLPCQSPHLWTWIDGPDGEELVATGGEDHGHG